MQEFKTRGDRHDFQIDGVKLYLPGATFKDFEQAIQIGGMGDEGGEVFRQFMRSHTRPWWRRRLMTRLSYPALLAIYKAWLGGPEGEASSSSGSQSTAPSSPQTSESSTRSDSIQYPDLSYDT